MNDKRAAKLRYGLVWPAHREEISDKDVIDFSLTTQSTAMPRGSGILLDIKDIHGRIFFPTTIKKFQAAVTKATLGAFFEIQHYAHLKGHELFFGIPVLHDTTLAASDLSMINARGEKDKSFLCPRNPVVQELIIDLLNDVAQQAPDAGIFLPFFRYPIRRQIAGSVERTYRIPEAQACCFCEHCRQKFKRKYGYTLQWTTIASEPKAFFDWLEWRCNSIEEFGRKIVKEVKNNKLVFEMDLCPKRIYLDGLFIDNGHDIAALSKIFTHILVHMFDRSVPPPPYSPTVDLPNDIVFMNLERLKKHAKVYAMMWNIATEADLDVAYKYASSIDVEIRFFVLYPAMAKALVTRIGASNELRIPTRA